jgi:hypothetical protein
MGGKCVKCSSTEDLEFDHIDPDQKLYSINAILTRKPQFVMAELSKCQLLCHSCHTDKTLNQRAKFQHGTKMGWMRTKCKCQLCDEQRKQWYLERNAKRRASNGVKGPYSKNPLHGTSARYSRGCRCDECRAANTQKERDRKLKLK